MDRKTILLVEDDRVLRSLIKGVLERQYRVLEAATCIEAIRLFGSPVDIALIDYILPDGDGLSVVKIIREMKPQLPVVIMTAYSTDNLAIKAFRAGVTDFIKKPVSFAYLSGKLSEIFERDINEEHPENAGSRKVFIMDCVAAFIDENYFRDDLSLSDLAGMAGMGKFEFCRTFKRRFGQSFTTYLNNARIRKAVDMLDNPDIKITEVAQNVGYNCVTYFERVFKSRHGLSPSRKKAKGI